MPQIINTNIASINAQRNLDKAQGANSTALQRLSSGLRINSAKDDAAGLAISSRFDSQIRGTSVAIQNAGNGISLSQTAEGSLQSIGDSLQRIRELALQSANDTNTAVDRQALQEEVDQLVAEISSVSEKANFNGKKLLDGSFQNASFQTGANVGDTINVSIGKLDTSTLGTAASSGVSTVSSNATDRSNSLVAGDLVLNGVAVGASDSSADGASTASQALSSIAIASAINKVSDDSGVTATVNANTAGGSDVASVAAAAATVTINGVGVQVSGSGQAGNLAADLQAVVNQVNTVSGQTGVVASVDLDNLDAGVTLTAADGRNIVVAGGATYGIGADSTYTGSVTLSSSDGSDINVSSNTGNSLENAGIEVGTYSGNNAIANGDVIATAGQVALDSGDLVINGVSIGKSDAAADTASTTAKAGSAIAKAAAINQVSEETGVTATANATQVTSGNVTAGAASVTINGVAIDVAAGANASEQVTLTVDAINQKTAQTGVRAEVVDDNQYQLIADDGRNVTTTAALGLSAATTAGTISLTSSEAIEISTKTGNGAARTGLEVGSFGGTESGQALKDIDITTVKGATDAVTAVTNALQTVKSQQAQLGAIQNRFEATISNLQVNNENLQASNSRIKDADFAAETAALSRSQVLQQAGISVLAQANGLPQQALSLLQ